jgi:hypothetical protein
MKDDDKEREAHQRRIREAFDSLVADGLLVDSGRKRRSPITGEWQTVCVVSEVAEQRAKRGPARMREGNGMNNKPINFQLLLAPPGYASWVEALERNAPFEGIAQGGRPLFSAEEKDAGYRA